MKSTTNDQASKAVADLLREASRNERAELKGKAKRAAAPSKSTLVVKQKAKPKKLQSEPPAILRTSVQATLYLAALYTILKKIIQQPHQVEGKLRVQEAKEQEIP